MDVFEYLKIGDQYFHENKFELAILAYKYFLIYEPQNIFVRAKISNIFQSLSKPRLRYKDENIKFQTFPVDDLNIKDFELLSYIQEFLNKSQNVLINITILYRILKEKLESLELEKLLLIDLGASQINDSQYDYKRRSSRVSKTSKKDDFDDTDDVLNVFYNTIANCSLLQNKFNFCESLLFKDLSVLPRKDIIYLKYYVLFKQKFATVEEHDKISSHISTHNSRKTHMIGECKIYLNIFNKILRFAECTNAFLDKNSNVTLNLSEFLLCLMCYLSGLTSPLLDIKSEKIESEPKSKDLPVHFFHSKQIKEQFLQIAQHLFALEPNILDWENFCSHLTHTEKDLASILSFPAIIIENENFSSINVNDTLNSSNFLYLSTLSHYLNLMMTAIELQLDIHMQSLCTNFDTQKFMKQYSDKCNGDVYDVLLTPYDTTHYIPNHIMSQLLHNLENILLPRFKKAESTSEDNYVGNLKCRFVSVCAHANANEGLNLYQVLELDNGLKIQFITRFLRIKCLYMMLQIYGAQCIITHDILLNRKSNGIIPFSYAMYLKEHTLPIYHTQLVQTLLCYQQTINAKLIQTNISQISTQNNIFYLFDSSAVLTVLDSLLNRVEIERSADDIKLFKWSFTFPHCCYFGIWSMDTIELLEKWVLNKLDNKYLLGIIRHAAVNSQKIARNNKKDQVMFDGNNNNNFIYDINQTQPLKQDTMNLDDKYGRILALFNEGFDLSIITEANIQLSSSEVYIILPYLRFVTDLFTKFLSSISKEDDIGKNNAQLDTTAMQIFAYLFAKLLKEFDFPTIEHLAIQLEHEECWLNFILCLIIHNTTVMYYLIQQHNNFTTNSNRQNVHNNSLLLKILHENDIIYPFILLYFVLKSDSTMVHSFENIDKSVKGKNIKATGSKNYALEYMIALHEGLGSLGLCTLANGAMLKLCAEESYNQAQMIVNQIADCEELIKTHGPSYKISKKDSTTIPINKENSPNLTLQTLLDNLEDGKDELSEVIEQCFFCMYEITHKKWRNTKHLVEHKSPLIEFTLDQGWLLFNFLKPVQLPKFDSKTLTINTEIKDIFEFMLTTYYDKNRIKLDNTNFANEYNTLVHYLSHGSLFNDQENIIPNSQSMTGNLPFFNMFQSHFIQGLLPVIKHVIHFILYGTHTCENNAECLKLINNNHDVENGRNVNSNSSLISLKTPNLPSSQINEYQAHSWLSKNLEFDKSYENYIEQQTNGQNINNHESLTTFDTMVLREIFYLLADYYFKNMYTTKSLRYYIADLAYNTVLDDLEKDNTNTIIPQRSVNYYCFQRSDTWAGIALVRSSSFEQTLRTVNIDFAQFPANVHYQGMLACFDQALQYSQSPDTFENNNNSNNHETTNDVIDLTSSNNKNNSSTEKYNATTAALTSLWVEKGALAHMLHSTASRKLQRAFLYNISMEETIELREFMWNMLSIAKECYVSASKSSEYDPEKWLYFYMLGKIEEKFLLKQILGSNITNKAQIFMIKGIHMVTDNYFRSMEHLDTEITNYPRKINFNNPPNYALEAVEVWYRIHAFILKVSYLIQSNCLDGNSNNTILKLLDGLLDRAWSLPFATSIHKLTSLSDDTTKKYLAEPTLEIIWNKCIRGLVACLHKCPQHYKSIKQMAIFYCKIAIVKATNKDTIYQMAIFVKNLLTSPVIRFSIPISFNKLNSSMSYIPAEDEFNKDTIVCHLIQFKSNKSGDLSTKTSVFTNYFDPVLNDTFFLGENKNDGRNTYITQNNLPSTANSFNFMTRDHSKLTNSTIEFESPSLFGPRKWNEFSTQTSYTGTSLQKKRLRGDKDRTSNKPISEIEQLYRIPLFANVWRIPIEEVERPGAFSGHVFTLVQTLLQLAQVTTDETILQRISNQLKKPADREKRYIYESERIYLYTLCMQSLDSLRNISQKPYLSSTTPAN